MPSALCQEEGRKQAYRAWGSSMGCGWGMEDGGQRLQRLRVRAHQARHLLEMVLSLSIYHLQFI